MGNNAFIELIAKLNRTKSKEQIKTDLGVIAGQLEKDSKGGLKIQCHIDTSSDAIIKLQTELNTLASKLKLNIGVDSKSVVNAVNSTVKSGTNSTATTTTTKIDKASVQTQIDELSKLMNSNLQGQADEVLNGLLERTKDTLGKSAEVWTTWERTASGELNKFSISVKRAEGDVQKFNYLIGEGGKPFLYDYTGSDKGVLKNIEQVSKATEKLQRQIINLKSSADDQSAPRAITSKEQIDNVTQAYNEAQVAVGKLKGADASTFNELNNEALRAVDNLKNVISMARNADSAATKLRAKPVETVRAEELANLDTFVTKISQSAIPNVENLVNEAKTLGQTLEGVTTKEGLTKYLNDLSKLEAEFKTLNVQSKATKDTLTLLDKALADPSLSANKKAIQSLRNEYQTVFEFIKSATSESDYQAISTMLTDLKPKYDALVESNTKFREIEKEWTARETQRLNAENEAIKELQQSYQRIRKESEILNNPKSTNDAKIIAQDKIQAEEAVIAKIKQRLADQNLLVDEVKKEILLLENERAEYDLITESIRLQREADEAATEQERKKKNALSEIASIYSQMTTLYRKENSITSSDDSKAEANRQRLELENKIANIKKDELTIDGQINQETQNELDKYQTKYDNITKIIQLDYEAAKAKQDEAKAEQNAHKEAQQRSKIVSQYIEQIRYAYSEMQKMASIINNPNSNSEKVQIAQEEYDKYQALIPVLEKELQIYLSSLNTNKQLNEQEQRKIDNLAHQLTLKENLQQADANAIKQQNEQAENERKKAEQIKKNNEEYNKLLSTIKEYQQVLSSFNNSNIVKQNKNNNAVGTQVLANSDLLNQLNALSSSLGDGKNISADKLKEVDAAIKALLPDLEKAKNSSNQFKNSLADERTFLAVTRQFNSLKNSMETFENVSKKAVNSTLQMTSNKNGITTFKAEWEDLIKRLNDPNIIGNKNAITELQNDFRNLEGQARSMGLVSSRLLTNMGSQLKMVVNRYISLYAVIGYIRKMIDAVKELDEAMINLRRVTDETESGYVEFLEKANKQSRDLKITTSELVQQVYQWSKLGYDLNDAMELSKASTIFSKVADISQETAQKNLVTALKAYGKEAKDVIMIVDQLDALNNKYAVDAAGLGDGLERSASAMAMTGNSLEQTIAMLTGAGEITQNLENTGSALKIMALRLQNMKGALEELNEPVDDLMEVSKVQTQILNLTHNQVDVFNSKTGEFRSTYDIIKDISEIWDSLGSTNRASLTEILFGKNRANIGLALIQSFQSGQTQQALKDAVHAAGTATQEYEKMMDGITAHSNALKGALQELSNNAFDKKTINGFIDFGKAIVNILSFIVKYLGNIGVILPVIMGVISASKGATFLTVLKGIPTVLKGIASGLGLIQVEATAAGKAAIFTRTALQAFSGVAGGLVFAAIIAGLSWVVDKLIVTNKEVEETRNNIHNALVDLKGNADELKQSENELDSVAQSYAKISTTVADVTEKKQQLRELQNDLTSSYQEEADGIDLVNGKYSEQLKKLDEIKQRENEEFKVKNASKIAQARNLSTLNLDERQLNYQPTEGAYAPLGLSQTQRSVYEISSPFFMSGKQSRELYKLIDKIEGVYRGTQGKIYLSGTVEDARDQLGQLLKEYSTLQNKNDKLLNTLEEQYNTLQSDVEIVKEMQPYFDQPKNNGVMGSMLDNFTNSVSSAMNEAALAPFNNKLDEAQAKLQQLANPDDLSLDEYSNLYFEVQQLEDALYRLAGNSKEAKQKVIDLFNGFKQGISENGDGLDKFVEKFESDIEENFKATAETVTTVQEAISKLGEGKGLSHTDAWKLLKADTEGYLQTIRLVNGEYVFAEEELIRFKDEEIKKTQESIKEHIREGNVAIETQRKIISSTQKELSKAEKDFNKILASGKINSQSDYNYYHKPIEKAKIKIEEANKAMTRYGNIVTRDTYLIEELNQNLGATRTISVGIETDLNNNVDRLEKEVKAIDASIDSLNNRKDILESEKKELQKQLELLNEQKKVLEEQQKSFKDAVNTYLKQYEESLKTQLDHIKDQKEEIKDEYDKRIKALKNENEERDLAYKKEKAILDLNKAKEQQVRTYSSARGWEYGANKETVVEAQKNLQDVLNEEQINELEKERDTKVEALEEQEKSMERQIKEYEAYVKQYEILTDEIEHKDGELLAEQLLGSDWREKIEKKDEKLLRNYKKEYQRFANELERLTKTEIKNIEDSIKAKEDEIDKIGDEIDAYNNYKTAVQNDLNDAKNALESYKNSVNSAVNELIDASNRLEHTNWENHNKNMQWSDEEEHKIWENKNKALQWYTEWGEAHEALQRRLSESSTGYGIINSAGDERILHGYADGGSVDYTGLAMLHGTKQQNETIFNSKDSSKLYNYVHETPNLVASMIEEAVKVSGFKFGNAVNNNSTANNINLNIGQVISNTPQEFIKNIDTHMDNYFRRKLTEGYVQ